MRVCACARVRVCACARMSLEARVRARVLVSPGSRLPAAASRMSSSRRVARRPKLAKVPSFGKSVRDISQIPHDSKKRAENPSNNSKNSKRLRFDKKTSEIHAYCARAAVSSSLPAAASQQQPPSSSLPAAPFLQQPPGTSSTAEARRNPKIAGKRSASSVATA